MIATHEFHTPYAKLHAAVSRQVRTAGRKCCCNLPARTTGSLQPWHGHEVGISMSAFAGWPCVIRRQNAATGEHLMIQSMRWSTNHNTIQNNRRKAYLVPGALISSERRDSTILLGHTMHDNKVSVSSSMGTLEISFCCVSPCCPGKPTGTRKENARH